MQRSIEGEGKSEGEACTCGGQWKEKMKKCEHVEVNGRKNEEV